MAATKARGKQRIEKGVQQARMELRDLLNLVEFHGERVVITRYDRPAAALVSMDDLEKIEAA